MILYVAKLSQSPDKVLTKAGFNDLIHEMIKNNQDWSLLKQLRKEITRLMLVLSQKYASECCMNSMVVYPSLFHSINDNSSESGYSSDQVFSSTDDTADSDWQLGEKKCACTRSGHSVSDAASHLTLDHDAHHYSSLNSKYVTDSASQDSNDQGSNSGTVMKMKVKKIVCKLVKKRPVRVAIHSLEVSFKSI